jgi:hypothetical protein
MKKQLLAAALAAATLPVHHLHAMLTDWSNLDASFGAGANRSALVIDWNNGSEIDTLTWGFFWDSAPGGGTVADLIGAVTAADPRLSFNFTDFGSGLGLFIDGIGFDANLNTSYGDPGDHFQDRNGGWAETFVYWEGHSTEGAWATAASGISSTTVQHDHAYGFSWNNSGGYPGDPPGVVPEPASVALVALGIGVVAARRRWMGVRGSGFGCSRS